MVTNSQSLLDLLLGQGGYNTTTVMFGAWWLGISAGVIGSLVLLRKRSLIGDALAHGTLPGIGLAFLICVLLGYEEKNTTFLLLGATITGVLAVLVVHGIVHYTRLTEDTAIGVVLSTFFGFGVVVLSFLQQFGRGNVAGLNHFIYGQAAAMQQAEVFTISIITIVATLISVVLFKEFRLLCFDENFASSEGWPVQYLDLILMSLVVLVVVAGLQAVGMIMIIALLIIPGATARLWTSSMFFITLVSGILGGTSGYLGAALSAQYPNLPAGSIIVLTASSFFAFSLLFAPQRGLFSRLLRLQLLRIRVAEDHLLLEVGEYLEKNCDKNPLNSVTEVYKQTENNAALTIPLYALPIMLTWSWWLRNLVLYRGKSRRLYNFDESNSRLIILKDGLVKLKDLVQAHRAWENQLLNQPNVELSLAHAAADCIEHLTIRSDIK
jgi:manganese/zinc/iron transport system permease protein